MKKLITNVKTLGAYLGMAEEFVEAQMLIVDGKIAEFSQVLDQSQADEVIDGRGMLLAPGLIDPQVHFREPGMEYKEDIESGSRSAARGGFTTVISMPNTSPTADNAEVVRMMKEKSEKIGICRVLPTGAVTLGLKGETLAPYHAMMLAGAVAFTDDGKGVQKDEVMLSALSQIADLDMALLDHSEDESLSAGGAIHAGEIAKKYGVKGIDPQSEAVHVKRGCDYSEKTGCHFHVLHVSTKASIEYVRAAKKKGIRVTAEVSPHHLLLCDEDIPERADGSLDANWKMNPPLRSREDRAACVEAFLDGTIDAVATDHAPHSPDEKANSIEKAPFGIIGLETAFPLLYTNFVQAGKMPLRQLLDLMTHKAASLFKLPYGTLNIGSSADIVLLDLEKPFAVRAEDFVSKSKNSPFIGQSLYGRTFLTMLEGKITYRQEGE